MDPYIEIINPWWYYNNWKNRDGDIKKWKSQRYKWVPGWLGQISLKPFSLNFIIGARQVGKTTGIKLLIKNLIEEGVNSEKIVYVDVDLISSLDMFQRLLFSIEDFDYIFLDEVTSLDNWWKPLRGAIDSGIFEDKRIVVSGSVSIKLRRQAELFPGRMGMGKILEILPLNFPEYVKVVGENEKIPTTKLRKRFEEYKDFGGFPGAINEKEIFYQEFVRAIESEILKAGLSVETSIKIFSSLIEKIPSAMSYQAIARDIGISYKTVEQYLEYFQNMFLVKIVYWREKNVNFRKEKKIFFRDPFILKAISFWTGTKFLESSLYEGIVQEHLYRRYGEIYYYRNKYEIDCVAGNLRVEVKAGKPHRKYPRNVLVLEEKDLPRFLMEF